MMCQARTYLRYYIHPFVLTQVPDEIFLCSDVVTIIIRLQMTVSTVHVMAAEEFNLHTRKIGLWRPCEIISGGAVSCRPP